MVVLALRAEHRLMGSCHVVRHKPQGTPLDDAETGLESSTRSDPDY